MNTIRIQLDLPAPPHRTPFVRHPDNHHTQRLYQNARFTPLPDPGPRFSIKIKGKEFITHPR